MLCAWMKWKYTVDNSYIYRSTLFSHDIKEKQENIQYSQQTNPTLIVGWLNMLVFSLSTPVFWEKRGKRG